MKKVEQALRALTKVGSFAIFGVSAWVLASVFYPLVWWAPVTADAKTAFIQKAVHHFFRAFLGFIELLNGMEFRAEGFERINAYGGGVVIANHPTLLDVVVLISRMPQADCIVKKELWNNFFLKGMVSAAGYLPNDDGPGLMAAAIERVRKGRKVIIFPEGTRSLASGMNPFSNGFAHIAVRAPCPLWPVMITCAPSVLRKGDGFFEVPAERPRLTASVCEPLNPMTFYDRADSVPIAVRKVAATTRRYFEERINDGGFKAA